MRGEPFCYGRFIHKGIPADQWEHEENYAASLTDEELRTELAHLLGPLPKGRRGSRTDCPVALGVGHGCEVGDSAITVAIKPSDPYADVIKSWGPRFTCLAHEFARRFDNGAYPDLVA